MKRTKLRSLWQGIKNSAINFGATFSLGKIAQAHPGSKGFLAPVTEDNSVKGFHGGGYAEGFDYIAAADASNLRRIAINHLLVFNANARNTTRIMDIEKIDSLSFSGSFLYQEAMDGIPLWFLEDGTMIFATRN